MTLAVIDTVADAVVAEINDTARSWHATLANAARTNYPLFTGLDTLVDLAVSVVPRSRQRNDKLTRAKRIQNHRIDVAVQKRPTDTSNTYFDPLKLLTEQLESWFLNDEHTLATYANARCIEGLIDPFPALSHIEDFGAYTAIIQLTFEVILP